VIDGPIVVELVNAQVVRPLRRAVLRPGRPAEESIYPADDDPRAAHGVVRHAEATGDDVMAVGSVLPDPDPDPDGWRIRGMATRASARRRGLGTAVLDALVTHVAVQGGGLVWCNARVPATGLYTRAGFVTRGEVFEIEGIGPHIHMWRMVPSAS
jgi:GNAT superfamily N-acetyltransferase